MVVCLPHQNSDFRISSHFPSPPSSLPLPPPLPSPPPLTSSPRSPVTHPQDPVDGLALGRLAGGSFHRSHVQRSPCASQHLPSAGLKHFQTLGSHPTRWACGGETFPSRGMALQRVWILTAPNQYRSQYSTLGLPLRLSGRKGGGVVRLISNSVPLPFHTCPVQALPKLVLPFNHRPLPSRRL